MKITELERLSGKLEEPAHLVVWNAEKGFEVVAVCGEAFEDAFPLPMGVQAAAAEAGLILDTTMAARLEIDQLPADFWESLEVVDYGEQLRVSVLGRPGSKYLEIFHAINTDGDRDLAKLEDLELTEAELAQVARWIREQSLFDHRSGDVIMEILTRLR